MYWLWVAVAFFWGAFFGSFFNVCIYRVPAGLSVNHPKRSFCFRCGTMIKWYHNVPILSWFILGGRCGSCGAPFSLRYAGIELLTALLFVAVFVGTNPPGAESFNWATLWYLAFTSLLLIGTFTDLDHWIIPDGITLGGTVAALVAALAFGFSGQWVLLTEFGPFPVMRHFLEEDGFTQFIMLMQGPVAAGLEIGDSHWWEPLANAVLGAVFGWSLLYGVGVAGKLLLGKDAMGFGDVKLFAMIGATLGITGTLITFFLACFVGVAIGGPGLIRGWLQRFRPPAPATTGSILAAGLQLFPLEEEDDSATARLIRRHSAHYAANGLPRSVHHMPFGPSIAIAAIAVIVFQHPIRSYLAQWIY
jgi:leader peptidase (prepilin peptidase)/N-methyltransferase